MVKQQGGKERLPLPTMSSPPRARGSVQGGKGKAKADAAVEGEPAAALRATVAELTRKLEDEKIKAAAALAKIETKMCELADEKIKADDKIKQVRMCTRAPRHDPHCAWYITSPRRPSEQPRCVRAYWHTGLHRILTLSHTHAQLEQNLQELRRQLEYVADGFLNLNGP